MCGKVDIKAMNVLKKHKKLISAVFIVMLVAIIFALYQIYTLQIAHSSFENYYKFRGCVQLIDKNDTYGTCKLSSGQIIKLVNVYDKWFLDGDLGW